MAIRIREADARNAFRAAVQLAESDVPVPEDWTRYTVSLAPSPSQTFIAMLATALLARAVTDRVEPTALKADPEEPLPSGLEPYSARGLATSVLVPECVRAGVHLGVTGREPLNNQPFFGKDRVHAGLVVRDDARPYFDLLTNALDALRPLGTDEARQALAAFIRVRTEYKRQREVRLELGRGRLGFADLARVRSEFISADPEGGRRGQAFVAAALDMAFADVIMGRINDPSRHGAGDVRAFQNAERAVSAEVKQKPATETDILIFAAALAETGPLAGIYTALSRTQQALEVTQIRETALDEYGVVLEVFTDAESVLRAAFLWCTRTPEEFLEKFPIVMHERLREIEAADATMDQWAETFDLSD